MTHSHFGRPDRFTLALTLAATLGSPVVTDAAAQVQSFISINGGGQLGSNDLTRVSVFDAGTFVQELREDARAKNGFEELNQRVPVP